MGYAVAAYVVTFGALLAYGVHLARQRSALARERSDAPGRNPG